MKKPLLLIALLVSVGFACAAFGQSNAAWQKIEARFRRDVLSEPSHTPREPGSPPNPPLTMRVSVLENKRFGARSRQLATLNYAQVKALLNSLRLQKATPDGYKSGDLLELSSACGAIAVSADGSQSHIESWGADYARTTKNGFVPGFYVNPCADGWGEKWSGYELTPASAQALRKRIAGYSRQIRDFESGKIGTRPGL